MDNLGNQLLAMNKNRIYLDYNATTPTDPAVLEAMLPYFTQMPGNAASRNHPFGWEADEAVRQARASLADQLSVNEKELVFTSGATESINLAIKGVFENYSRKGQHIITVKTEHNAVLDVCKHIEKRGGAVTYLDVDRNGLIDLEALFAAIRPDTILISVMWANNETGVLQPVRKIGELCRKHNIIFLCDATQAVGKIPVHPKETGIHLMAFTAHKLYGPKGVGALFVSGRNPRIRIAAQIHGGGHENDMRSGTLNVPGIVGLSKALQMAEQQMASEMPRLQNLRTLLETGLQGRLEAIAINGHPERRMPHVSNITFKHIDAEALMNTFNQNIAASTGSACSSASLEPSHVLLAMGLSELDAKATVRFSLGRYTTEEEIKRAIELVCAGVQKLRAQSPVWEMYKEGIL